MLVDDVVTVTLLAVAVVSVAVVSVVVVSVLVVDVFVVVVAVVVVVVSEVVVAVSVVVVSVSVVDVPVAVVDEVVTHVPHRTGQASWRSSPTTISVHLSTVYASHLVSSVFPLHVVSVSKQVPQDDLHAARTSLPMTTS